MFRQSPNRRSLQGSVRRASARAGIVVALAGGLVAGPAIISAQAQVSRTGTPIAELATLAVNALKGRDVATVQPAVASAAPVVNLLANQIQPSALPAPQPAPGLNQPPVRSSDGWSSVVVDSSNVPPANPLPVPQVPNQVASQIVIPVSADGSDPRSRYPIYRAQLAQEVATRSGLNAAALDAVWARTDERRLTALFTGLAQVGTYYRSGGTDPSGFDCSGFTGYSWSAAGVKLPRSSGDQINAIAPRTQDQLQPGDLVWRSGHIAMYVGMGEIVVDSPQTGRAVGVKQWGKVSRFGSPV